MAEDIKTMLGDAAERKQLSPEKLKALQLTMDKIDKTYGRGSIMKLGDENIENIEVIPSLLRELDPEKITSYDVAVAAGKGDKIANEIFEFTGKILGEACADFAAFSSPEAFIFFGGLTKAGDLIMNPIKKAYDETVLNIFKGKAKFLVSGLEGSSAAVLGASAVGWDIQD